MDSGKVFIRIGIIAGLAGLAIGLYSYFKQQWYYLFQYCYKVYKLIPRKFTKDSIEFDLTLKILNRSNFAMTITGYDMDIYLNDKYITNVKSDKTNILQPMGISYLDASIKIVPKDVMDPTFLVTLVSNYISDQSKIILKVKGHLTIKALNLRLPVEYTDNWKSIMTTDPNAENMKCPNTF